MLRRLALALLALPLIALTPSAPVLAESTTDTTQKGLYVSPLRTYLTLKAGESVTRAITVGNHTDAPMTITTDLEQFSMVDYSYDYRFDEVDNDWVHIVESSVTLQPYKEHALAYTVTVPKNATPGGHYYTLYAAARAADGKSTVRIGSLLYLTVEGSLTRSLAVTKSSAPYLTTGATIPYSLDIKNTGNVHYFALVSAQLDSLFYHDAPNGSSQLLMPGTTRAINASIRAPLLPGIYKLTYVVAPEHGASYQRSQYIVHAPLWSIMTAVGLMILVTQFYRWRQRHRPANT